MADEEKTTEEGTAEEGGGRERSALVRVVLDGLKAALPDLEPAVEIDDWVVVQVPAERWREVAQTLRDDERLNFNYLSNISAVDYQEKGFQVVYHLVSIPSNRKLTVKIDAPGGREAPEVPSVTDLWPTADWHEREAWDLMGVRFTGHPNLKRILMREDWVGHPLRKDYVDDRPPRERVRKEDWDAAVR